MSASLQAIEDAFVADAKKRGAVSWETEMCLRYAFSSGYRRGASDGFVEGVANQKRRILADLGVLDAIVDYADTQGKK